MSVLQWVNKGLTSHWTLGHFGDKPHAMTMRLNSSRISYELFCHYILLKITWAIRSLYSTCLFNSGPRKSSLFSKGPRGSCAAMCHVIRLELMTSIHGFCLTGLFLSYSRLGQSPKRTFGANWRVFAGQMPSVIETILVTYDPFKHWRDHIWATYISCYFVFCYLSLFLYFIKPCHLASEA